MSAEEFAHSFLELLYEDEAYNSLMIKSCEKALNGCDTSGWFCAAVERGNESSNRSPSLLALRVFPFNILLSSPGGDFTDEMIRELVSSAAISDVPGVVGSELLCDAFARIGGRKIAHRRIMNMLMLRSIKEIPMADGILRPIRKSDLDYLPKWMCSFHEKCEMPSGGETSERSRIEKHMYADRQYVLEKDGVPVSTAEAVNKLRRGIKITSVYTPPSQRGKGYCLSCVSRLASLLLDEGNEFVVINADAANPVSNHVYRKIGFEEYAVQCEITFA